MAATAVGRRKCFTALEHLGLAATAASNEKNASGYGHEDD